MQRRTKRCAASGFHKEHHHPQAAYDNLGSAAYPMDRPSLSVTKKLFVLSRGQCAFPDCKVRIVKEDDPIVVDMCHIKARSALGPRPHPELTDEELFGFANLILLCRNHHKEVDDPLGNFTEERLKKMKEAHESRDVVELAPAQSRIAERLLEAYVENNVNIQRVDHSQVMVGSVGGKQEMHIYHNNYQQPPKVQKIVERRPDAVSREQAQQIQKWIGDLAEKTTNKERRAAYAMWQSRFKNRFKLSRYDDLPAVQFTDAMHWYGQQKAIGTHTLPEDRRKQMYAAIHATISRQGLDKETYYRQIAVRLKMGKPFGSLTELTLANLKRVYRLALDEPRDS